MNTEGSAMGRAGAGAVLYAKDLQRLATFYAAVADLTEVQREHDFAVLENAATQLTIVAIPERIAAKIETATPPRRREETPIKLFFAVSQLDAIRETVVKLGGALDSSEREWQFRGSRVRDGHDPEGNVFQLRQAISCNPARNDG